jgi:hypothetical protein
VVEVTARKPAEVEVRLARGTAVVGRLIGLEPADYPLVAVGAWGEVGPVEGRVGRDGRYRIDHLAPGDYSIIANFSRTGQWAREKVKIAADEDETALDLTFEKGLELSGVVRDRTEPVAGVQIQLDSIASGKGAAVRSDDKGHFAIKGLEPGSYLLQIGGELILRGDQLSQKLVHLQEVELTNDQEIVLEATWVSVAGQVLDGRNSEPLDGVWVRLDRDSPFEAVTHTLSSASGTGGRFRLDGAPPGAYRLLVQRDGYAPAAVDLTIDGEEDQEDLEIELEPTKGVLIAVTLPSGDAAREIFVQASDPEARPVLSGTYSSDTAGKTRLNLGHGRWRLLVASEETAVSSVFIDVPGEGTAIALQPEARLDVRVPDLKDEKTSARAIVLGPDGRQSTYRHSSSFRDESTVWGGETRIRGLAPGTWTVRVEADDGRVWQEKVTVAGGDNPELVLGRRSGAASGT